jgi:hypothetical protein
MRAWILLSEDYCWAITQAAVRLCCGHQALACWNLHFNSTTSYIHVQLHTCIFNSYLRWTSRNAAAAKLGSVCIHSRYRPPQKVYIQAVRNFETAILNPVYCATCKKGFWEQTHLSSVTIWHFEPPLPPARIAEIGARPESSSVLQTTDSISSTCLVQVRAACYASGSG